MKCDQCGKPLQVTQEERDEVEKLFRKERPDLYDYKYHMVCDDCFKKYNAWNDPVPTETRH